MPPPIPKFIRDGMDITDIAGSHPKKEKLLAVRDSYNVSDIRGAKPRTVITRTSVHD